MSKKSQKLIIILFLVFGIAAGFWYFLWSYKTGGGIDGAAKCKDCNLIMISLSNISAEHMSLYGYERLTTPNLDQWAKDAVVFENAFTQTSWTLPVATSLFTSLYPYSHRVMDRFIDNILDENIKTLPEILRDQGYKTAAFTGGLDYSNSFGHMRGFEDLDEAADFYTAMEFAGFGPSLDKAASWLKENKNEKFFLFIHGYDAHCPFDPPQHLRGAFSTTTGKNITVDSKLCLRGFKNSEGETYEAYSYRQGPEKVLLTQDDINYLEDLYDEEILSVDALVGNFLNKLDKTISGNTIIVVFSDHGEMFAKHGRFGRAGGIRGTLYDDVIHVPLIIKTPFLKEKLVNGLVQIIDIMPTLLNILDLPQPKQTQGKDLLALINGEKKEINKYVFAGSKFGFPEAYPVFEIFPLKSIAESVRSKEWKLIHEIILDEKGEAKEEAYELYDFENDPGELRNLAQELPDIIKELKDVLKRWKEEAESYKTQNVSSPQLLPQEIIDAAKQHGYW
ncbi:MAG: sulfatase-like hydrolase/transferase [Candidatus Nealsonbacteria bacterium]